MGTTLERFTEASAVLGYAPPVGSGTSEVLTGAIDLSKVRRVAFYVQGGTLGTAATLTFVVKGATTSGGTYTAIAATQVTLVKATDDNLIQVVEISTESIQALGLGYAFIKGSLTPSVASQYAVLALGSVARYEPTSSLNSTSVKAVTQV